MAKWDLLVLHVYLARSVTTFVSLQFYWSSSVIVPIVLGARGIVPVVCSIVLFSPVV